MRRSVVSSRRCRRQPRDWKEEVNVVRHSECGGVTEYTANLHIYSRDSSEGQCPRALMGKSAKRDLSAILDSRSRIGIPCQPPAEIGLKELAVWEMPGGQRDVSRGWVDPVGNPKPSSPNS